ncbi:hypothetical protein FGRMN_11056, partial [Fusarium graminum]
MFKFLNSLVASKLKAERRDHVEEKVGLLSEFSSYESSEASTQPVSASSVTQETAVEIPAPNTFPPSHQSTRTARWKVNILFSTGETHKRGDPIISPTEGWFGHVILYTPDIVGLMQEGLHLSQSNVQVQETHLTPFYSHKYHKWYLDLHFTLIDARWTGTMVVRAHDIPATKLFRMEHVSADRVYMATVVDTTLKEHNFVYRFKKLEPSSNVNCILNDELMEGLWPWPRKDSSTIREYHYVPLPSIPSSPGRRPTATTAHSPKLLFPFPFPSSSSLHDVLGAAQQWGTLVRSGDSDKT